MLPSSSSTSTKLKYEMAILSFNPPTPPATHPSYDQDKKMKRFVEIGCSYRLWKDIFLLWYNAETIKFQKLKCYLVVMNVQKYLDPILEKISTHRKYMKELYIDVRNATTRVDPWITFLPIILQSTWALFTNAINVKKYMHTKEIWISTKDTSIAMWWTAFNVTNVIWLIANWAN